MSNILEEYNSLRTSVLDYMEYLYANGLELDENGNEVPIDKNKLILKQESDEDE